MIASRGKLRASVAVLLRGTYPLAEREDYTASLTAAKSPSGAEIVAEVSDLG